MNKKVVKSVGRVFEILELFDRERKPLSAVDVARELKYPHTSALAILKSMETLGYMEHSRENWSFIPSQRISEIGEWVSGSLQNEQSILNLLSDLHDATGETINISRQAGEFIKILHGLESTKTVGISVRKGVVMPLNASHTGMVALATSSDREVSDTILRLQATNYSEARQMTVRQALREVQVIREQKFAPGYDLYIGGISAVCFPVIGKRDGCPFIIGIVGPTDRIRKNEDLIISAAKESVERHCISLAYP